MSDVPVISECDLALWTWRKGLLGVRSSVFISPLALELSPVHGGAHGLLRNKPEHVSTVQVHASPACLSSLSKNRSARHKRALGKSTLTQIHFSHLGLSQVTVKLKHEGTCHLYVWG